MERMAVGGSDGNSGANGGCILSGGSNVTLLRVSIQDMKAGDGGDGSAAVTPGNAGGKGGAGGSAGAIYMSTATLSITDSTFLTIVPVEAAMAGRVVMAPQDPQAGMVDQVNMVGLVARSS